MIFNFLHILIFRQLAYLEHPTCLILVLTSEEPSRYSIEGPLYSLSILSGYVSLAWSLFFLCPMITTYHA
ncbi:hypothetical protein BDV10DRAFT_173735 [Aspergillus recurvatus]